jgi:hypothetical protein
MQRFFTLHRRAGTVTNTIPVMRGLDPRIHLSSKSLSKKMDGRVKPGHDASEFGTVPALRSGMKNAAPRPGHESGQNEIFRPPLP